MDSWESLVPDHSKCRLSIQDDAENTKAMSEPRGSLEYILCIDIPPHNLLTCLFHQVPPTPSVEESHNGFTDCLRTLQSQCGSKSSFVQKDCLREDNVPPLDRPAVSRCSVKVNYLKSYFPTHTIPLLE